MKYRHIIYAVALAATVNSCAGSSGTDNSGTAKKANPKDSEIVEEVHNIETDTFSLKGSTYLFIKVDGGEMELGASEKEKDIADKDELPRHRISLNSFYIGQTEVTQKLWQDIMGENPSTHKGDLFPVENVSWDNCQTFIKKLNATTGLTFRLPTEAEWEYAAKGGKYTHNYLYSGSDNVDEIAWYNENRGDCTHIGATKKANELGLYDMSGNVAEWCNDWYDEHYYTKSPTDNPKGPEKGEFHVIRGGGWFVINKAYSRCSNRSGNTPGYTFDYLGLRLVLEK